MDRYHVRRALPVALGLLAVAVSVTGAQTAPILATPTPAVLAARHDSLVGGRAVLEQHRSMRIIGTFVLAAAGIDAPLEILKVKPNKYLFRSSLGPMGELMQGFDGTTAWATAPGQGPALLTGAQATSIAEQADFFGDLHDLTRFASSETVGEELFEGRRSWKVKHTRPSGDVLFEYFDIESGLSTGAVATTGALGEANVVSVFSDYKDFGGLRMATRILQRQPQFEVVIAIVAVEFDTVADSLVALPPSLRQP